MNALEVDATQFMLEILAPANLARVVTELPGKVELVLPVLQVIRVGGPNDRIVTDMPTFAVHGFAAKQKDAYVLLLKAFTVLTAAVGRVVTVDGGRAVMSRVDNVGGPAWASTVNPDYRHAVSTIQARIRAV